MFKALIKLFFVFVLSCLIFFTIMVNVFHLCFEVSAIKLKAPNDGVPGGFLLCLKQQRWEFAPQRVEAPLSSKGLDRPLQTENALLRQMKKMKCPTRSLEQMEVEMNWSIRGSGVEMLWKTVCLLTGFFNVWVLKYILIISFIK